MSSTGWGYSDLVPKQELQILGPPLGDRMWGIFMARMKIKLYKAEWESWVISPEFKISSCQLYRWILRLPKLFFFFFSFVVILVPSALTCEGETGSSSLKTECRVPYTVRGGVRNGSEEQACRGTHGTCQSEVGLDQRGGCANTWASSFVLFA